MKEKIEELYDGLKERLKSNFLLTFVIIWLLHHWRLIYSIFNFDSDKTLVDKRAYIAQYLSEEGLLYLWVFPLFWTFVSMIFFYGFSSLSEILNIVYHNIRKIIYKKWDNEKLKTIEEYLEKVEENKKLQLQIKYLEESREVLLASSERLEKSIGVHNQTIADFRKTEGINNETITQLTNQLREVRNEKDSYKSRFEEADSFKNRKARTALFELLNFQGKNTSQLTPEEIRIENVFIDSWLKIEYENYKVPSYHENIILFDGLMAKDKKGSFFFKVTSFSRFFPNEIYLMNYIDKNNVECAELLIKVDSDLIVGKLSKKGHEESPLFVEYKSIAEGSTEQL